MTELTIDLSPDQVREMFHEAIPSREVFCNGEWRTVARTTLIDDVRTEMNGYRLKRLSEGCLTYGARLGPGRIWIIDSISDG